MAFWQKWFGTGETASSAPAATAEHEGYRIAADPVREGSQFRLAATISREIDGEVKSHRLIRADLFTSEREASDAAIHKARRVIDEQGDRIFDQG